MPLPGRKAFGLRQLRRGASEAFTGEAQARELVLSVLSPSRRERTFKRLPRWTSAQATSTLIAARAFGQILAKRLHPSLLELRHGSREFDATVALFLRRKGFEQACWELHALASSHRARPETSKSEII